MDSISIYHPQLGHLPSCSEKQFNFKDYHENVRNPVFLGLLRLKRGFPQVVVLVVVVVAVERVVGERVVERVVDLVRVAGLELPHEIEEPLAESPLAVDVVPLARVVDVVQRVVVFLLWVRGVSVGDVVWFWVVELVWFLVVDVPPARAAPSAEAPLVVEVDPLAGLALG